MEERRRAPRQPGELKTIGREVGGKAEGLGLVVFGTIVALLGPVLFFLGYAEYGELLPFLPLGVILLLTGGALAAVGGQKMQKARFVAWTREALERDRFAASKEDKCPRCGTWNVQGTGFCSSCGLSLELRCVNCGSTHPRDSRFCAKCGRPMTVER